jgi:hypothetical protein
MLSSKGTQVISKIKCNKEGMTGVIKDYIIKQGPLGAIHKEIYKVMVS